MQKIEQLIAGIEAPKQIKNYRDTALRIKNIVEEYYSRPICDYLRKIALNLELQV